MRGKFKPWHCSSQPAPPTLLSRLRRLPAPVGIVGSWDRWLSHRTVFQIGGRLTSRPRRRHRRQRATGATSWSAGGPGPGRGTVTCRRRHTLHGHGEIQQISALRISQATATRACLSPTETCSSLPGTSNTPPQRHEITVDPTEERRPGTHGLCRLPDCTCTCTCTCICICI